MIGILSDIHGNLEALQAVFRDGQDMGVQRWICLGDIVGYGPNPVECIHLVQEKCSKIVMGNHDEACAIFLEIDEFNRIAKKAIFWTRNKLTDEHRDFLRAMKMTEIEDNRMYVHASPKDPILWHYIFNETEARRQTQFYPDGIRYCFIGHTHEPFRVVTDTERELINVGSVGQPRDYDPRASYVLFNEESGVTLFRRVDYDIPTTQRKIIEGGLPHFLADRLQFGN